MLEQAAERELNWSLAERQRFAREARSLVADQRRLPARQERELFPEVVKRLTPEVLGQLTEQLWKFDEASAARGGMPDVPALRRSVLSRYAATLPPSRELER